MKTIALFGAPRSGTSWLGHIFNSSSHVAYRFQPLFSFAFKSRLTPQSSRGEICQLYEELVATTDEFVLQTKNVSDKEGLKFYKNSISHLVWKEVRYHHIISNLLAYSDTKFVGIVRHPCAVINSWLRAPKEFKPSWNQKEEWKYAEKKNAGNPEEFNGYNKWKEIAFLYKYLSESYPKRVHLITYERLHDDTKTEVKKIFDFAGLALENQTMSFIEKSKTSFSVDPYDVFRSNHNIDEWKVQLDNEIAKEILNDSEFHKLKEFYKW